MGFLRDLLAENRKQRRYRLPTARKLAALARVGPVAMLKAVRRLCIDGELDARPRQGIVVTSAPNATEVGSALIAMPEDAHLAKWERVYRRFQSDLLNGVFAPGEPCPSCKELAGRYGTSYASLRRAIGRLVAAGALAEHKRGFRVPAPRSARPGATVLLVARGSPDGALETAFPRSAEALRTIDSECSRRNLGLKVFGASDTDRPLAGCQTREIEQLCRAGTRGSEVLGCALFSSGLSARHVEALAVQLAALRKPLSLFDDSSGVGIPHGPASLTCVFRATDTQSASRRIGRLLLQLGHRRIAYVSPTHAGEWSQQRLAGLEAAFAEAGVQDGVAKVTCDTVSHVDRALGDDNTGTMIASRAAAALAGRADPGCRLAGRMLERVRTQAGILMETELLSDIEAGLFRDALSEPGATAWVTSSDYVAARALAFLRVKGVAVPGKLSLVGFDDSMEAFAHGITSYNFDMLSVVRAMLAHILDPQPPGSARGLGLVTEIEGFVTERRTTGRAPGPSR